MRSIPRHTAPMFKQMLAKVLCSFLFLGAIYMPGYSSSENEPSFHGLHYKGKGDVEYLQLLETARRMLEPDPEYPCLPMLYMPEWNGLVEGPTWSAWWIQNSYGTTYSALPFLLEPYVTFLRNSQALWFDAMGDGKTEFSVHVAGQDWKWVPPDGCLCDAARPGWVVHRQGDGRVAIHDWGMEFTAAGLLMQAEFLLIEQDIKTVRTWLPILKRCADLIESRRDGKNNLFLAGPAGNLLAPSYAGWKKPDGTYDKAYLAGLSITYIAALDRLIELERLVSNTPQKNEYIKRRDLARKGLQELTEPEGYFIRSLDPDGVRHGVFGAEKHGYFEASPNHDAIAFQVVDDQQARRIMDKMLSIPELRPHDFVLPNYPSYDDMYEKPEGLWGYGTWVNGGHWSTCEARMILAYYRMGQYEEARRSMKKLLTYAKPFRMDNPLTECGNNVYQPDQPYNVTYDAFGPPAAFLRGLFEYIYTANELTLVPHIPPGITELVQLDPIRFGDKVIYLAVFGTGPITGIRLYEGKAMNCSGPSVTIHYHDIPEVAHIAILRGNARGPHDMKTVWSEQPNRVYYVTPYDVESIHGVRFQFLHDFLEKLEDKDLNGRYEASHMFIAGEMHEKTYERRRLLKEGKLTEPVDPERRKAVDELYLNTQSKLYEGLKKKVKSYENSRNPTERKIYKIWQECEKNYPENADCLK